MLETLKPFLIVAGVLLGVALLVALGIALALTRDLRRTLRALTDALAQMAEGAWPRLPAMERQDELGELARGLSALSAQWWERLERLRQQTAAQTTGATQQAARAAAVARVSHQLLAVAGTADWLATTVGQMAEQCKFYHVGVFLLDDARQAAILRTASSEVGQRLLADGYKVTLAESPDFDAVVAHRRAIFPTVATLAPAESPFPQTRSEVLLPLTVAGDVIGVLDIHSTEAAAFDFEQMAPLQMLADTLSLAWRMAHIQTTAAAQIDELNRLLRTQSEEGWGRLTQERRHWGYGYDGVEVRPAVELALDDHLPQWVLPLQGGREAMGALKIFADPDALDANDLDLARAVVDQAGRAMESARLFSKMQIALEEVGVLYRCSQALGVARTEEQVLRAFVDYLIAPEIDRCVLALIEPGAAEPNLIVRLAAAWDADKARSPLLGDRWEVAKIPVMAQTTTAPLAIPDVAATRNLDAVSRQVFQEALQFRALMLVPLVAGGQLWGWLLAAASRAPYHFTERERRVYRSLSDQAALVLQSIRLMEQVTQRAERERRVTDITAQIRRNTDVDTILQTAIRELGRTLRASDGLIRLGLGADRHVGHTQPLRLPDEVEGRS